MNITETSLLKIGINRNIVECKVIGMGFRRTYGPGINRNIVECKVRRSSALARKK